MAALRLDGDSIVVEYLGAQRLAGLVDLQQVDHAGFEVQAALHQPDRVGVCAHQILVAQFQPRWCDRSGHHVLTAPEVIGVVRIAGSAVGQGDCRLTRPASSSRTLRIVGGSWRDIAHANDVEALDIYAEFHRGRAVQHRKPGLAEFFFPLLTFGRLDLSGVFARLQADELLRGFGVERTEVRIDPALRLITADGVRRATLTRAGIPGDEVGTQLVTRGPLGNPEFVPRCRRRP